MNQIYSGIFVILTLLLSPSAQAQTPSVAGNLLLNKGGTEKLGSGNFRYGVLQLGEDSVLTIVGTTTIIADKFISAKGATIRYLPGSQLTNPTKTLSINAVDASEVRYLRVEGNGAHGADYKPNEHARHGDPGTDAGGYKLNNVTGRGSSPGQAGTKGAKGRAGEDALHVTLYLPNLKGAAEIITETIGGNGGKGQSGGNGGRGGNRSKTRSASSGGGGGAAGEGGDSGAAGKVAIFVVVGPDQVQRKDDLIKALSIRPVTARGEVGDPGKPGRGGDHGEGSALIKINEGGGERGRDGDAAGAGKPGAGPKQGEPSRDWIIVDVMDTTTYAKYLANMIAMFEKK